MAQSDRDFVDFIKHTLAPELKESGRTETAKDFKRLVRMIEKLWRK